MHSFKKKARSPQLSKTNSKLLAVLQQALLLMTQTKSSILTSIKSSCSKHKHRKTMLSISPELSKTSKTISKWKNKTGTHRIGIYSLSTSLITSLVTIKARKGIKIACTFSKENKRHSQIEVHRNCMTDLQWKTTRLQLWPCHIRSKQIMTLRML